jgi:3-hydroxyacyl-CoA dehydrogenase
MDPINIRRVTVLGAGTMGSQIAGYLADLGYEIDLFDLPGMARKAWQVMVKGGRCTLGGRARVTPREMGRDDAVIAEADLVVEAVFEELELKNKVGETIERHARPDCILTTNTSGISIDTMASARGDAFRRRYFGVHFFNPLKVLPLAELIPGRETDPRLFSAFADFAEKKLGKGVVIARDTPNFIGNRIGGYALYAPFRLNTAGLNPVDIDAVWKTIFGWEPLKTWDIIGLQLARPVAQNVYDRAPDDPVRELWHPDVAWIQHLVERGLTGRSSKARSGFFALGPRRAKLMYDFEKGDYGPARRAGFPSLETASGAKGREGVEIILAGSDAAAEFARKCLYGVVAYASAMVGQICDEVTDIDEAMRWGFNWPRGPFEVAQALGLRRCLDGIAATGNMHMTPQWLRDLAASETGTIYCGKPPGGTCYSPSRKRMERVRQVEDGVYPDVLRTGETTTIHENEEAAILDVSSPVAPMCLVAFTSRGNSAGPGVLAALNRAMDWAEKARGAVIIGNTGPHFCPGADLRFLLEKSEAGAAAEIEALIREGQQTTQRLTYSSALTVAAPHGYTLGGGSEIALGAKVRVVNQNVIWGQPEINPGLIPGWGGCMRLLRTMMRGLQTYYLWGEHWTREVAGDHIDPVWRLVCWAEMSRDAHHAKEMGFLERGDVIVPAQAAGQPFVLGRARREAEALLQTGYRVPDPFVFNLPGRALLGRFKLVCDQGVEGGMFPRHNGRVATAVANVMCGGDARLDEPVTEQHLLDLERESFMKLVMTEEARTAMRRVLKL